MLFFWPTFFEKGFVKVFSRLGCVVETYLFFPPRDSGPQSVGGQWVDYEGGCQVVAQDEVSRPRICGNNGDDFSAQEGWCWPPDDGGQVAPAFNFGHQRFPNNPNGGSSNQTQSPSASSNWPQTNTFTGPRSCNKQNLPPPRSTHHPQASPPLPPKTRLRQAPVPPPDWGSPGCACNHIVIVFQCL